MPREYVYGPFQSRRLGLSLGVNVLTNYKLCTFNCVYCEIGLTTKECFVSPHFRIKLPPSPNFRKELFSILKFVPHLDSITFGYNGEPTLNENLLDFFNIAKEVRSKLKWTKEHPKLTLFTNSSTLHFGEIRERVKKFELILAKLDAGNQNNLIRTNRPHPETPNFNTIVDSLINLRQEMPEKNKLALQILIYNSYREDFLSNNTSENISKLAQVIKKIKPNLVQIYSTARIPAEYYVFSIDDERKKEIAETFKEVTNNDNIEIKIY